MCWNYKKALTIGKDFFVIANFFDTKVIIII